MSISKLFPIERAKKAIDEKKMKIVLSLCRCEDGATLDYDIYAMGKPLQHVCSLPVSEEELRKIYSREWSLVAKTY